MWSRHISVLLAVTIAATVRAVCYPGELYMVAFVGTYIDDKHPGMIVQRADAMAECCLLVVPGTSAQDRSSLWCNLSSVSTLPSLFSACGQEIICPCKPYSYPISPSVWT